MGPNPMINTTSMAPVGMVLPSSAIATLPPARLSPMIPDPTTVARSAAVPSPSAAMRRYQSASNITRALRSKRPGAAGTRFPQGEEIRADFGFAAAAIPGQIAHERSHAGEVGAIHDAPPVSLRIDETGRVKRREVERETRGRDTQLLCNLARGAAFRVRSEEQAEGPQPMGVGEGAEASDRGVLVHDSIILELSNHGPGPESLRQNSAPLAQGAHESSPPAAEDPGAPCESDPVHVPLHWRRARLPIAPRFPER